MKLVINSENLKVSIEAKGNLDERHVISAYQLATGDFKALFVEEETNTQTINLDGAEVAKGLLSQVESPFQKGVREFEKDKKPFDPKEAEWVQTEYICPACGMEGRRNTIKTNKYVKCYECNTKIKLERAVPENEEKETDKAGNYFIANDFFEIQ